MAVVPRIRMLATLRLNSGPRRGAPTSPKKVRRGSTPDTTQRDWISSPAGQQHTGGGSVLYQNAFHLGPGADFGSAGERCRGQRLGKCSDAALYEGRGAEAVGCAARGVVEHAEGASHGARAVTCAEQGGRGEHSLERVAGEPVVEEVPGGEGEDAKQLDHVALAEPGGPDQGA